MKGNGLILLGVVGGLLVGCAPPGPPLPPLMGPGPWGGIGWLFLIVIGVGIWLLAKKVSSESPPKRDHLAETLNDIHERLKQLEKKIDKMEKGKNLEKDE